ncbi:MAG: transcriptional repressor [Bacteroidota bacterium]
MENTNDNKSKNWTSSKSASEVDENEVTIVKNVFIEFLNTRGHKTTSERLAILEEIYNLDSHFDVVELHHQLRLKNYKVSMATIYNNIRLYEDAGLITSHRFGKGMAQYERCYFRGSHDHIIFIESGKVVEFKDDRINKIKKCVEETFGITVERHSLYFYARPCPESKSLNSVDTFLDNFSSSLNNE